jgi:hypothetical protein
MPCYAHAALCCSLEKSLSERHCHGMCESNTAALCKSNGKYTNRMAGKRHGMCELVFKAPIHSKLNCAV